MQVAENTDIRVFAACLQPAVYPSGSDRAILSVGLTGRFKYHRAVIFVWVKNTIDGVFGGPDVWVKNTNVGVFVAGRNPHFNVHIAGVGVWVKNARMRVFVRIKYGTSAIFVGRRGAPSRDTAFMPFLERSKADAKAGWISPPTAIFDLSKIGTGSNTII